VKEYAHILSMKPKVSRSSAYNNNDITLHAAPIPPKRICHGKLCTYSFIPFRDIITNKILAIAAVRGVAVAMVEGFHTIFSTYPRT
jgi:hypothetical protein